MIGMWTFAAVSAFHQVAFVLVIAVSAVPALETGCYNGSMCEFGTAFMTRTIPVLDIAAAQQFCCELHGATLHRPSLGSKCFKCPPRITSLPSSSENLANQTVSLGKASDVVVRLRCGVGPIPTSLTKPPIWMIQEHPALNFVEDRTVVEISSVRISNPITLQCVYIVPDTLGSSLTELNITSESLFFTNTPSNVDRSGSSSVELNCPVPDLPNRSISWFNAAQTMVSSPVGENGAITVDQDGSYFCQVEQGDRGTYNSRNIVVFSSPPPANAVTLQEAVSEVLVVPGDNVTLNCNTSSADKQWLHNGVTIPPPPNEMLINVSLSQSGFYQCQVGGLSAGNKITSTYVNVVNIQLSTSQREFKVGQSVLLPCSLQHPVAELGELSWYKGSTPVSNDARTTVMYSRVDGVSMATLTIDSALEADSGDYHCKADLYIDSGTTDPVAIMANILVDVPPSPPVSVNIHSRDMTSAVVSWQENPANSGLNILSYLVMWRKAAQGEEFAEVVLKMPGQMTYNLNLPSLTTFTEYVIQIASTDRRCNSTFSPASTFTTLEGIPENEPRDFTATAIHHNIVELKWTPPSGTLNGILSRYRISYRETGSPGTLLTVMATGEQFEVTSLTPETEYTFYIEAGTSVGFGPQSPEKTVTTISEVMILNPDVTPQSSNLLSSTVSVEFSELQVTPGSLSHYWLAVVKLPKSSCALGSGIHPDAMFPHEDNFTSHSSSVEGKPYVAAEIGAGLMSFPFTFVFGDPNHPLLQQNGNFDSGNPPLEPESCYTFFIRGFTNITASRKRKDVSQRRYRSYVSSQFMEPVATLPATAWLQIRFSPVRSCSEWTNAATTRRDAILSILATQINSNCGCGFNFSHFIDSSFSCVDPRENNEESVVFKALVQETNGYSAPAAVADVSAWKDSGPGITVDVSSFQVCASCETAISSKDSEDCQPCNPPTEINYIAISAGVSAGTVVILLTLLIVIIVTIAVCRYRSSKHKNAYSTDERSSYRPNRVTTETPVVIENPPPHSERPAEIEGKRYSDMRPTVVGGSVTDLPIEYIPYPVYPMPPPDHHPMNHHASNLSLSSGGNATPNNYPLMSTLYPLMGPGRPMPPGMMPVPHTPVPHHLPTHRRSKSSDMDMQQMGMTPSHSRQPSDATVQPDPRRQYEYMYYPYPYYQYYPYHHHMPSSSGYASPSSRRMMMSERDLVDRHHLAGSGYSTPHLPRRPHTADMLETEFTRGGSPLLYHRPQDSIISQPEQVVHPFPRKAMRMHPAFSTSHLPSNPVEGDSTMERFINEQLKGSQQQLPQQRQQEQREEGTPARDSYPYAGQPTDAATSKTNVSDVGSLSSVQPGSGSIESEVL